VSLNQLVAEFSFCTPSAPPLTYTFKLIRPQDHNMASCGGLLVREIRYQLGQIPEVSACSESTAGNREVRSIST